mmetsp:Transcript_31726/g.101645  ORF Transcript_31726/g.101645 Transcript_31726/m.101645 type:complete len:250 (+) Transcript_31726:1148-1897(+)
MRSRLSCELPPLLLSRDIGRPDFLRVTIARPRCRGVSKHPDNFGRARHVRGERVVPSLRLDEVVLKKSYNVSATVDARLDALVELVHEEHDIIVLVFFEPVQHRFLRRVEAQRRRFRRIIMQRHPRSRVLLGNGVRDPRQQRLEPRRRLAVGVRGHIVEAHEDDDLAFVTQLLADLHQRTRLPHAAASNEGSRRYARSAVGLLDARRNNPQSRLQPWSTGVIGTHELRFVIWYGLSSHRVRLLILQLRR